MKVSSFTTFGIVLVVFLVIQGWMLERMFIAPRVFTATEATMMGQTTEIRVPVEGIVQKVLVKENDSVMENQTLFTLTRMVTDPETQQLHEEDMAITSIGPGIVTDLVARNGLFVQAAQKLVTVVDNSPDALFIRAKINVSGKDVPLIQAHMPAKVQANFLFDGKPVDAMVDTVDPTYDNKTELLSVRLKLFRYPDGIENLPLGLPVEAWVQQERPANDNLVMSLYSTFFPRLEAQQQ